MGTHPPRSVPPFAIRKSRLTPQSVHRHVTLPDETVRNDRMKSFAKGFTNAPELPVAVNATSSLAAMDKLVPPDCVG